MSLIPQFGSIIPSQQQELLKPDQPTDSDVITCANDEYAKEIVAELAEKSEAVRAVPQDLIQKHGRPTLIPQATLPKHNHERQRQGANDEQRNYAEDSGPSLRQLRENRDAGPGGPAQRGGDPDRPGSQTRGRHI